MSICIECAHTTEEECKTCCTCELNYCSTSCGDRHRGSERCGRALSLPTRAGRLTACFLAKPALQQRAAQWRAIPPDGELACLLCGAADGLGRSGAVLCPACHLDYVEGKRAKKKRPPPEFKIEEWVSAEDMRVVEADRRAMLDYVARHRARHAHAQRWERMLNEMCGAAPDHIQERVYAVWDRTRDWPHTVRAFDRLSKRATRAPAGPVASLLTRIWRFVMH